MTSELVLDHFFIAHDVQVVWCNPLVYYKSPIYAQINPAMGWKHLNLYYYDLTVVNVTITIATWTQ